MGKLISKKCIKTNLDFVYDITVKDNHNYFANDILVHNCSPSSIQGKQILNLKKKAENQIEWIPMTGTPIVNKPTDVFLPLRLVDGHHDNSYWSWCQQYCVYGGYGGYEIIGYKNIPHLKDLLLPNMLRRLKKDILDLPEKMIITEYVDNTPYQEKLYDKVLTEILSERDEILTSSNPLTKLMRLRQVNGSPELVDYNLQVDKNYLSKNAKIARVMELVNDIIENDEKVVIFSNWVESLRTLFFMLRDKYQKVCIYTGTMNPDAREKHKQAFIHNPNYHIILGTIGALGTSHTLTSARNMIFLDTPWNEATFEQATDRIHRPGQTAESVNIYKMITRNTVDERVNSIMEKKGSTADFIVDGELNLRGNPQLLDFLLYQEKGKKK